LTNANRLDDRQVHIERDSNECIGYAAITFARSKEGVYPDDAAKANISIHSLAAEFGVFPAMSNGLTIPDDQERDG
jgi:hypothetical protein